MFRMALCPPICWHSPYATQHRNAFPTAPWLVVGCHLLLPVWRTQSTSPAPCLLRLDYDFTVLPTYITNLGLGAVRVSNPQFITTQFIVGTACGFSYVKITGTRVRITAVRVCMNNRICSSGGYGDSITLVGL